MQRVPKVEVPRARFHDASPLGGKGLRLLLERLGYSVKRCDEVLSAMPADARVWILVDPQAGFSKGEASQLLSWVASGHTLIWATGSITERVFGSIPTPSALIGNTGQSHLRETLGIKQNLNMTPVMFRRNDDVLPPLSPLQQNTLSDYWCGVSKASASGDAIQIDRGNLAIAGTPQLRAFLAGQRGAGNESDSRARAKRGSIF
jgi:hypothetical protein